jgi:NAD(P)H-hydrate epimerase
MKILNVRQIRDWDQYTIRHEPISSIDLMERAAKKSVEWLQENNFLNKEFIIFCGKGNNGGDGLAIARMLLQKGNSVSVYILESGADGSDDFQINLLRLKDRPGAAIYLLYSTTEFPAIKPGSIIIDALFGSGLSRPLEGIAAKLVEHINGSGSEIISIDVPSGLFIDTSSKGNPVIKSTHTLSFQCTKLAFLVAENAGYIGSVHILDIGLHKDFYDQVKSDYELTDKLLITTIYKPRDPFAHKGKYGHAMLVAGSYGKMGAAILAAQACLRSGVGLLTCYIPQCGYEIMQRTVPEAMVSTDFNSSFITKIEEDLSKFTVVGIGPGLGTAAETRTALSEWLLHYKKPVVIDADGLNGLSMEKKLFASLPPQSILTPHPKEFERLFGESENDFERMDKTLANARSLNCIIVLKGHHTLIATPGGKAFFNSTGNPGMAKGGSGDVLTGVITALLAQGYTSEQAALLGVYIHGLAGDIAAKKLSPEAMVASDIVENLGEAFKMLTN